MLCILNDPHETVKDVDGIITTKYDFSKENWKKIANLVKEKTIFDGRNILDNEKVEKLGFKYCEVGR